MIIKSNLTNALLSGTLKANRKYEKMSRGAWLCDYGVEGFMASFLAMEVAEVLQDWYTTGHVTLEEPIYSFSDYANAVPKRGPKKASLREGGRVDLALWKEGKGGDHLIGAVEAKRGWNSDEATKDIARLRELQNYFGKVREGQMQYTAFVTFLYAGNDPDGNRMEKLHNQVDEWVADNKAEFGFLRLSFAPKCHLMSYSDELYRGSAAVIEVV